jgi:putative nucleotidyltransferase with HDIG domain
MDLAPPADMTKAMGGLADLRWGLPGARMTPTGERLLADVGVRLPECLSPGQRRSELIGGTAFLAAATSIAPLADDPRAVSLGLAVLLVLLLASAARVEIQLGCDFAVPTQLFVVPMLLLLPLPVVAPLVALAMMLSRGVDVARGRIHAQRILLGVGDAWFVVGPVVVLALAGVQGFSWSDWPWWLAALAAQFAVDALAATAREWLRTRIRPPFALRDGSVAWLVDFALAPIGLLVVLAAVDHPAALLLPVPLVMLVGALAEERRQRLHQALQLSGAYQGVALLLGEVIEDDDGYTGEHSKGVVWLTLAIADELGLDEHQRRLAEFGALLHDVGKIAVPNEIINKPGPLDDAEWAIMKRHTISGQQMLDRVGGLMTEVGVVVRASHEHFDGRGYPDGLAGDAIPLAARVVSCADAFSAMTTDRSYREAMAVEAAVAELTSNAGTQFDPEVVRATIEVVRTGDISPSPEAELLKLAAAGAAA